MTIKLGQPFTDRAKRVFECYKSLFTKNVINKEGKSHKGKK